MEKGYFYFISDEYYEKFSNEKLMQNKEMVNGNEQNRPCYYAFQDEDEKQIYWMIPVSSKTDKYLPEYQKSMNKYRQCDTISFGYLKGEYNVFLLQNMCPITQKYILNQYYYSNTFDPIAIPNDLKRELNAKARKIIRKAKAGTKLTWTNILEMQQELLREL